MIGDRFLRLAHHALAMLLVVGATIALTAQTVVDPQFVEFTPSADHNTLASDGSPLVQRYSLTIYAVGSSVPFDTMDLGKPAPSAGIIRVNFIPLLHNTPTPGVTFEARVTAVGPSGSTASSVSNNFSFQGSCSPMLNSTGQSVGSGTATGSVGVTAGTGCTWSAASNANWVTLTGATNGTGNGSVPYSVAANPNTSSRTGTLTVAGQTYTINQAALPCSYSLSSANQSVAAGGGTGSTSVTSPAGCAWNGVSNNASWLTVTAGASGSGSGTVSFSAAANASTSQRTGTLTIGGQTFTVTQAGAACSYSLSQASQSVAAGGGTGSTGVTVQAGCSWTAVSNNTGWLTVTGGASGTGNGSVQFSAANNASTSQRVGTLTVGGEVFTVTQAGAGCTFGLSATSMSASAAGGNGFSNITAGAGCPWSAASNDSWITVTSAPSGTGNGSVLFTVGANPNASARTGTLTIASQTFTVSQAAAACTYTLIPPSQSMIAGGGSSSTAVLTPNGCTWTAVTNAGTWLTITSGTSGNGDGTIVFAAAANPSPAPRTGTLTIGGQTFTLNQGAAPCTYGLSSTTTNIISGGGTASTNVTTLTGCTWTAVSNNTSWLTISSGAGGNGSGTVNMSVTANTSSQPRTGSATIAGQAYTVTQDQAGCSFSISPTSQSVVAAGANGSSTVTTTSNCSWVATSNFAWITVTSGGSGTGNGTANFTVAPNSTALQRTGTLTVAGRTFTVTQAANTCSYTLTPTTRTMPAAGGSATFTVGTASGCVWAATTNQTWISVSGSGTASGSVSFTVQPNAGTSSRVGAIAIGTQVFTVVQNSGSTTTAPVAPGGLRIVAIGGN